MFQKHIVGVTFFRYQNGKRIFFNFVRINYGLPFIQKMKNDLQCHGELYEDNISSSSENDSLNVPSKRLKLNYDHNRRTVYTGRECLTNLG